MIDQKITEDVTLHPEEHMTPVDQAVVALYNALTPALRIILGAGIPLIATLTQAQDGTLSVTVDPSKPIARIDPEKKVVYVKGEDPKVVDVGVGGGDCCAKEEEKAPGVLTNPPRA